MGETKLLGLLLIPEDKCMAMYMPSFYSCYLCVHFLDVLIKKRLYRSDLSLFILHLLYFKIRFYIRHLLGLIVTVMSINLCLSMAWGTRILFLFLSIHLV